MYYVRTVEPSAKPPRASAAVAQASLVIVDCLSRESVKTLADELKQLSGTGVAILAVNDNESCRTENEAIGLRYDPVVRSYFSARGRANMKNMLLYILQKYWGLLEGLAISPPVPTPNFGIYHPLAPEPRCFGTTEEYLRWYDSSESFTPSAPFVGILFFPTNYNTGQLAEIDALVLALESLGFNVFPTFGYPDDSLLREYYSLQTCPRELRCLVSLTMKFANTGACVPLLRDLKLPVVNLLSVQATEADWLASRQGLSVGEVPWQIAVPEMSGLVQHTVVGARRIMVEKEGPASATLVTRAPVRERIERTVARVKSWISLQQKPESEKRIAFIYYNYPSGKHRIGASYLNVFRSLSVILNRLAEAGYTLGSESTDEGVLLSEALDHGRNVSCSAPGELEKLVATGKCVLVPVKEYETWFREMPMEFQEFVCRHWGLPTEAKLMTWADETGKYFVIPCVRRGNVLMVPQGLRGWSDEDHEKLYHNQTLPPPHQYVAVYLWLAREFKADAVVHVGRHSTHEFLSGKELALSGADAPEALIGAFPNIYIYIVDGLGEGIIAKRRGAAAIVDHNIPPLKRCGKYGRLAEIIELDITRTAAVVQNPVLADALSYAILDIARRESLHKEIAGWSEDELENLHKTVDYVRELQEKSAPCGMHTFGTCVSGELLDSTARIIVACASGGESAADAEVAHYAELIRASATAELDSLIAGLDGKFIRPGPGNDPVRCPDALPTGKNFYSFDPRKIPRKVCWELGSRLAEEAVENYRARNAGKYPEKMAFNVWCVEVVRHEGVVESQILRLLGVRPVWDAQDKVVDLKLIPREELTRPRVDVVVTISGIYRDAFGALVVMLDRAARMAARADELDNEVRIGLESRCNKFVEAGYDSSEAEKLASARIFGPPPGEYGTKISSVVSDSARWECDREVADVYFDRMCHAYGDAFWNLESRPAFEVALSGVKVVFHSRSSNVYGVLDNDDSFQYAGGLICAIRALDGASPPLLVTNLQDPRRPRLQHISEYLGAEARSRYFNPEWVRHMMAEGYAGGKEITEFAEHLWGWQVTVPESVDESKWVAAYDTYIADVHKLGTGEFFEKHNPWARQVFAAQLLEVARKGYWPSAGQAVLNRLAEVYAKDVEAHGIACAGITCDNPELTAAVIERLKDRAPALARSFRRKVEEATKRSIAESARAVRAERSAICSELLRTRAPRGPAQASSARLVRGFVLSALANVERHADEAFPVGSRSEIGFVLPVSLVWLVVLSGFWKSLLDTAIAMRMPMRPFAWLWSVLFHVAVFALAGAATMGPRIAPGRADSPVRSFAVRLAHLFELPVLSLAEPEIVPSEEALAVTNENAASCVEMPVLPEPAEPVLDFAEHEREISDARPDWSALEPRPCRNLYAQRVAPKTRDSAGVETSPTVTAGEVCARPDWGALEPRPCRNLHAQRVAPKTRDSAGVETSPTVTAGEVYVRGDAQSSCDAAPDGLQNRPPSYPLLARRRGWEGVVVLESRVAPDGTCLGVRVVISSGHDVLDLAALRAVREWRFVPAVRDGLPVETTVRLKVVFNLVSYGVRSTLYT